MQFRKGDRVRFLNEKGEGTITRIIGSGQVMVEVEDGFEFPFPVNQLVPAVAVEGAPRLPQEKKAEPEEEVVPTQSSKISNRQPDGIYLALIPQNQHIPSAGRLDMVLFNHSDYEIYYALALKEYGKFSCIQAGALGPRRQAEVETLTPQEVDNWATLTADVLFFSEDAYDHREPVSQLVRFRGVKLFKDSSYSEHLLTDKKPACSEISALEAETRGSENALTPDDLRRMLAEKEKVQTPRVESKPALKNQLLEKEVDLHIEELLDNWNGMTNAQLLHVQLTRMQQELDAAMAMHLRKIVFIHGVGNGRLKSEVRRVLGTYKGIRYHDASYQKYGFGATEVEII